MYSVTCPSCFIVYGISEELRAARKKDHGSLYCPSGHGWHYTAESDEEKFRRERDLLKQQIAEKDDAIRAAQAEAAAAVKREKRLKKRVGAGVCPCCHRTVRQMALHMKEKHPEFGDGVKPRLVSAAAGKAMA